MRPDRQQNKSIRVVNTPSPEDVLSLLKEQAGQMDHENRDEIVRRGSFVGSHIECFASLPRAMNYSRRIIDESAAKGHSVPSGTVILADTMTECKGRFSRTWHAPSGGAWGCMIHAETLLPVSRAFIPMAVGVACCETVRAFGLPGSLRWVNDVLVGHQKLAGFLVETYTERKHGEEFTLVGFGINVNNTEFPGELTDTAVSIRQLSDQNTDLAQFTLYFLARLAWYFGLLHFEEAYRLSNEHWSGTGGMNAVLQRWLELTDSLDRRVVYGFDVMTAPQYEAHLVRVDEYGGIVLQLDDGYEKTEYSGEIRYLTD